MIINKNCRRRICMPFFLLHDPRSLCLLAPSPYGMPTDLSEGREKALQMTIGGSKAACFVIISYVGCVRGPGSPASSDSKRS